MADRIRIAFIGASHSHGAEKVRVVRQSPDWELAGVWEQSPAVRASLGETPFLSLEAILRDPSIPAVAVESEVRDHDAHGRLALEAGKHVHLEKPPADTYTAFREMADLAERKHLLLQMGYMWRYNPAIVRALEAARNGWLGRIYLFRAAMNTLIGPDRRPEWAEFRGGQMFEQGAHLIDIAVRLLGRPDRVTPFLRKHGAFEDTLADNTAAVLEYPQAMAIVMASTLQPGAGRHRFVEILGSDGTAVVRPIEPPSLAIDLVRPAGPYKAGHQIVDLPRYQRYEGDFAELAAAIRERRPLALSLRDDLLVQETLMRASEM